MGATMWDLHWRDEAACLGSDLEMFFPAGNIGDGLARVAEAKQVCRGCGVREACLAWALEVRIEDGVFGGLDPAERRALQKTGGRRRRRLV